MQAFSSLSAPETPGSGVLELFQGGEQVLLRRKKVPDQIYDYIVMLIFQRKLRQGERILEANLADAFGVSKVSIREALVKLSKDGWIQSKPNQGTYVSDYSDLQGLTRLYRARLTMEVGAFSQLATSQDEKQLEKLQGMIDDIEKNFKSKDLTLYRIEEVKFHCTVIDMVGGPMLEKYFQNIFMQIFSFVPSPEDAEHFMTAPSERELPTPSHRDIIEALRGRQVPELISIVEGHVLSGARAAGIVI